MKGADSGSTARSRDRSAARFAPVLRAAVADGWRPETAAMTQNERGRSIEMRRVLTQPGAVESLAQLVDVFGAQAAVARAGSSTETRVGVATRRLGTTPDDSKRRRNTHSRGHFGAIPPICPIGDNPKGMHLQAFLDAGGGTRTPDTRIMIPLSFGLAEPENGHYGQDCGHAHPDAHPGEEAADDDPDLAPAAPGLEEVPA